MKKLLLFDIDGTLLKSKGTGTKSMENALADLCGKSITTEGIDFAGRTDPQIIRDILNRNGVPNAEELLPEALAMFEAAFCRFFEAENVQALPGAVALIKRLHYNADVQLALLTGNMQKTGYLKVEAIGLHDIFPFGAFGSDNGDRYQLPALAVERAELHTGKAFSGRDVVIIGDTHHDIRCGESLGVFSVAVATGSINKKELSKHEPDLLLDDLTDQDAFINAVMRN